MTTSISTNERNHYQAIEDAKNDYCQELQRDPDLYWEDLEEIIECRDWILEETELPF